MVALTGLLSMLVCGCGKTEDEENKIDMSVTSENISNGVWDPVITNTAHGENTSPELTWSEVNGAGEYVIYMIDPDGGNWIHWIASGITNTHVDAGAELPESEYIGPYPPSGTHRYIVTVYALKAKPDSLPGRFDSSNRDTGIISKGLDVSEGKSGNVISSCSIEGTYTAGD